MNQHTKNQMVIYVYRSIVNWVEIQPGKLERESGSVEERVQDLERTEEAGVYWTTDWSDEDDVLVQDADLGKKT